VQARGDRRLLDVAGVDVVGPPRLRGEQHDEAPVVEHPDHVDEGVAQVAVALAPPEQHGVGPAGVVVVLVFYPFAFSGICTGELREIRDGLEDFEGDDIQVLAVSCDPMFALRAWADAQGYYFPLLSDYWPHGEVTRAYGVLNEATGAPIRGTFLIGRDGVVRWTLVNGPGERRDFSGLTREVAALR
jgi:peroxiredoxin (alkyl hydroperoxide reductase subunit C)